MDYDELEYESDDDDDAVARRLNGVDVIDPDIANHLNGLAGYIENLALRVRRLVQERDHFRAHAKHWQQEYAKLRAALDDPASDLKDSLAVKANGGSVDAWIHNKALELLNAASKERNEEAPTSG